MTDWKCTMCGYKMTADMPPEECPMCKNKCAFADNTCYTPDTEGCNEPITRPKKEKKGESS